MINVKNDFPIFQHHPDLHYLDSGATTQTPKMVIDAMDEYYTRYRSNTHRGMYGIAVTATEAFENARGTIAKSLNAETEEIIFTSGTTHGMNALAHTLSANLFIRDNVVVTKMEHHANLVPWQQMAARYGFELRFIDIRPDFRLDMESAKKLIDANTKIVSFTYVSNVLGTVNPAKELVALAKSVGAITIIDAAQAAPHFPIDVKAIDCDFLVYSGHKIYGPTGIGVLYGKRAMLEKHLQPFFFGGEMVLEVTLDHATWNEVPLRFEAGTQNIAGAIGLAAAINYRESIGWADIMKHEEELTAYLLERLQGHVQIIGPSVTENRIGAVAFTLPGIHPHDVAEIMGNVNVAIRAGSHCAMPLHQHFGVPATVRASLGIYNTRDDVDALIAAIEQTKKVFS